MPKTISMPFYKHDLTLCSISIFSEMPMERLKKAKINTKPKGLFTIHDFLITLHIKHHKQKDAKCSVINQNKMPLCQCKLLLISDGQIDLTLVMQPNFHF